MPQDSKSERRALGDEFKSDAVNLFVRWGYSFRTADDAVDVGEGSLGFWPDTRHQRSQDLRNGVARVPRDDPGRAAGHVSPSAFEDDLVG